MFCCNGKASFERVSIGRPRTRKFERRSVGDDVVKGVLAVHVPLAILANFGEIAQACSKTVPI